MRLTGGPGSVGLGLWPAVEVRTKSPSCANDVVVTSDLRFLCVFLRFWPRARKNLHVPSSRARYLDRRRVRLVCGRSQVRSSRPANILSWRFGHEKNSTAILSIPLIQEGRLLITGEGMCTKYW